MLIDLQLHSNYSDGYLSPEELAKFISNQGIRIAALTDHNTVGGLDQFKTACEKHKIKAVPGIELYVKLRRKQFNLLWFNFDEHNPLLHKLLRETHLRRRANVRRSLNALKKHGLELDVEKILDNFNRYIPINHLVDYLFKGKNNQTMIKRELGKSHPREEEIIRHYLKNRDISFLPESCINIMRVLQLRKKIGGTLILNHPAKYGYARPEFIAELKKLGFDGIEVLSPHHSLGAIMFFQQMAKEHDFISTGGSDFHRFENNGARLQHSWEYFKINSEHLRKIEKIITLP